MSAYSSGVGLWASSQPRTNRRSDLGRSSAGKGAVFLVGVAQEQGRFYFARHGNLEFFGVVGDFAGHPRFPQPGDYELGEFVFGFVGEGHKSFLPEIRISFPS